MSVNVSYKPILPGDPDTIEVREKDSYRPSLLLSDPCQTLDRTEPRRRKRRLRLRLRQHGVRPWVVFPEKTRSPYYRLTPKESQTDVDEL